jgi:hypothetical protein
MKMNKVRVRHEDSLTSNHEDTKTQSFEKLNSSDLPALGMADGAIRLDRLTVGDLLPRRKLK